MHTVLVTTSPVFGTVGRVPQFIKEQEWEFIRCSDPALPDGGIGLCLDRMEYLVVGLIPASADIIRRAPKLRGIVKHGVGVDNIDIAAATARKIPVLNAPGANSNAVAELAMGCILSLARRIPMAHAEVLQGLWKRSIGSEIANKTLGIVGLGNIGKQLALKAAALGMRVVASELYPDMPYVAEHHIEILSLADLLRQADYVSLHIFGGKDNTAFINAETLSLMKPTACLLNLSRGEVVDMDALADALARGVISGAAIDAYATEPPDVSHPIFSSPKVVFTPHTGGDTAESVERVGMMNVTDIVSLMAGEHPPRILNPEIYV
jgi:D-3-phosphoglycerate dehydrogenase